ncbi:MAG: sugar transferase [Tepidiformaceae bacterium]
MPKRVFDVTLTLFFAPVAALLTVVMALVLAVELRGGPFFAQQRIGRDGRPFTMYKLRTMRHAHPGAERPYIVDDWTTYIFSVPLNSEPRLTRWGAFARKTSIDELPNLVNVVRGEMSLVGPRPEIPELVCQYPPHYHRRHDVLPGIAGLAQVNGRSDLTYDESVSYDLRYVDGHSVAADIRILWRSLLVVLRGTGAR